MVRDRMFHVLVLGGIALVADGCGGATSSGGGDAGAPRDASPQDAVADALPVMDAREEFPSELPPSVEASVLDAPADAGADGFPVLGK